MNPNEWFQPSPSPSNGQAPATPAPASYTQPQPNTYASTEPPVSELELAAEGVEHGAKPVLWLGVLLVVVLLATLAVAATNPGTVTQKLPRLVITAVDALLAGGVVLCGIQIQAAAPDHTRALKAMTTSVGFCASIIALSVVEFFVTKRSVPPLQGGFALAAAIFLLIKHAQLKKLS